MYLCKYVWKSTSLHADPLQQAPEMAFAAYNPTINSLWLNFLKETAVIKCLQGQHCIKT